jgi:tRNA pseudouridine55 synthase
VNRGTNASVRVPRRRLDGVLLLDKAVGISSNHALQAARRLYRAEKAGHTGTLDPLASGLLPLCFGEATKFSGELLDADKQYLATVQLGITTDTADAEGRVLETRAVEVSANDISAVLAEFVGEVDQVPPMYSALKRDGKPLYEYARAGIEIERKARRVVIYDLHRSDPATALVNNGFMFEVRCSKGTYVRTLAADIGERLGCGAHLTALRRTAIGDLSLEKAHTLSDIERLDETARDELLLAPDFLLAGIGEVRLDAVAATQLKHGQTLVRPGQPGLRVRAYGPDDRFIGLCQHTEDDRLRPLRLVADA